MERLTLSEAFPAATLTPNGDGSGRYRALLIKAGWGSSGYYPREVLQRDGAACWPAGTQNYLDHPTMSESIERPERSVKDWASVIITDPVWDEAEGGLVADVEVFPQWQGLLNEEYAKRVGLSIRASGIAEHGEAEGREGPIVKQLTEGISVDWVTRAGAGGKVLQLIESARDNTDEAAQAARLWEAKYDADQLKALLAKGQAVKNDKGEPSYPIADEQDLKNAIRAVGRGGASHNKIRAYITRRAKALGNSDLIPADWNASGKSESERPAGEGTGLEEGGRTIGSVLEARIHTAFTLMADDMRGDGRLTRPERIGLSTSFGAALKTFTDAVEADLPQLYERSPWECPEDESEDTPMSEALNEALDEAAKKTPPPFPPKKGDEQDAKDTSKTADGTSTGDEEDDPKKAKAKANKMKEAEVSTEGQLSEARISALLEAALKTHTDKITALESRLAESDKRDQGRDNAARARTLCTEALTTSGLPSQAHPRVMREATANLPTGEDGALDETKLDEAIKAAIQEHKTFIAELAEANGWGAPRGLGGDAKPSDAGADDRFEEDLAEAFREIGLDDDAAKTAAAGR